MYNLSQLMHSAKSRAHSGKTYSLRYTPCALQELVFIFTTEKKYLNVTNQALTSIIIFIYDPSYQIKFVGIFYDIFQARIFVPLNRQRLKFLPHTQYLWRLIL